METPRREARPSGRCAFFLGRDIMLIDRSSPSLERSLAQSCEPDVESDVQHIPVSDPEPQSSCATSLISGGRHEPRGKHEYASPGPIPCKSCSAGPDAERGPNGTRASCATSTTTAAATAATATATATAAAATTTCGRRAITVTSIVFSRAGTSLCLVGNQYAAAAGGGFVASSGQSRHYVEPSATVTHISDLRHRPN
jgi:hypothetical protein